MRGLVLEPMSEKKKRWPWAVGAVALVVVAGVAGTGVWAQHEIGELTHGPGYSMVSPGLSLIHI